MIQFTVYGIPQSKGSVRAFLPKGHKRPIVTTTNKALKPWAQDVAQSALVAMQEQGMEKIVRPNPVSLTAFFYFEKPKSAKKNVVWKTTKPDVDKLLRALGDALTGICYEDDAQIANVEIRKAFGTPKVAIGVCGWHEPAFA